MRKINFVLVVLMLLALVGCGSNKSSDSANSANSTTTSAKTGTVPINIQILPASNQTSAVTKTTGKMLALASPFELDLRRKIDKISFYTVDDLGNGKYIDTISVINGVASGTLVIPEGNFSLQSSCLTKSGCELYSAYTDITVISGQTTNANLVFKKRDVIWLSSKVKNVQGYYLPFDAGTNQYYTEVVGLIPSFTSGDNGTYLDDQGFIHFSIGYSTAAATNKVKINITDCNGAVNSASFTLNLLSDIDEADIKGYTEKTWPAPGTVNFSSSFEEDGGLVKAVFAANSGATLNRNQANSTLAKINIANGSNKTVTISELKFFVWDVNFVGNFKLYSPASGFIYPNCTEISRNTLGQAKISCPVQLTLSNGIVFSINLLGDIGDYPSNEMLSIDNSGASVIDNSGNAVPFSSTGQMSFSVN